MYINECVDSVQRSFLITSSLVLVFIYMYTSVRFTREMKIRERTYYNAPRYKTYHEESLPYRGINNRNEKKKKIPVLRTEQAHDIKSIYKKNK